MKKIIIIVIIISVVSSILVTYRKVNTFQLQVNELIGRSICYELSLQACQSSSYCQISYELDVDFAYPKDCIALTAEEASSRYQKYVEKKQYCEGSGGAWKDPTPFTKVYHGSYYGRCDCPMEGVIATDRCEPRSQEQLDAIEPVKKFCLDSGGSWDETKIDAPATNIHAACQF